MKLTVNKPTVAFTEGDLEAHADWLDIQTRLGTFRLVELANGTVTLSAPNGKVSIRANGAGSLVIEVTEP